MENINTSENSPIPQEDEPSYINLKFKKPKLRTIALSVVVILILIALFFLKGLFVAAIVNGSPISRLLVIKELEQQGGKRVLEDLINQKLIKTELDKQDVSITQEEINEEINKIEMQVASQGRTLQDALAMQGMTEEKLREQITIQKKLEKLLMDKIAVSDAEIDIYIKDNKAAAPKGTKIEDFRKQLSDQLKRQKFQQEAQKWVANLTANAKIKYYIKY